MSSRRDRHTPPRRALLRSSLALAALLALGACGGARTAAPPVRSSVSLPAASGGSALPSLPASQVETGAPDAQRVYMDVENQDLATVLRDLASKMGLGYQIDPAIQGNVTTRLDGMTLQQALDALVLPHGYSYSMQGNVLRVVPTQLRTRIFSLDYLSLSRVGTTSTVVQRQLGGSNNQSTGLAGGGAVGGGGGAGNLGGGMGGGGDVISSVTVADLWNDLQVTLQGLLFDAGGASGTGDSAGGATTGGATTGGGGGGGAGGMGAPTAFSRVESDGKRLIVNPMSGTVLVTASPEKLADVERYLSTIESSVQRQVLIEAKIVEVTLNREFRFGIDWEEVQRLLGQFQIRLAPKTTSGTSLAFGLEGPVSLNVSNVLRALDTQGEVRVLSSPQVAALNNQRAVINVSTDEVFFSVTRQPVIGPNGTTIGFNTQVQPQQIAVGIVLNVLPQISAENTITMNVHPVVTDVISVRSIQLDDGTQASAPVLDRRETDTVVRARGGETVVMGGLMQTRSQTRHVGIPVLKDLPLIGGLFGTRVQQMQTRELVIFLTPTVVAGQAAVAP